MTNMHNHQRHAATGAITKDKCANSCLHITAGLYIITLLALTLASDPPCYTNTHLPSPHRFHLQACPLFKKKKKTSGIRAIIKYSSSHKNDTVPTALYQPFPPIIASQPIVSGITHAALHSNTFTVSYS